MTTKDIQIKDFDYNLPEERIAKYPLPERDTSKLLFYNHGSITDHSFKDITKLLPCDSILFRNNTKVIRARLIFEKSTGAKIEVFCLDPSNPTSYELSLSSHNECQWHCMIGNAKKWKVGSEPLYKSINIKEESITLKVERIKDDEVRFSWDNIKFSFADILEIQGILPIPPYLNRESEIQDLSTYQTVYAQKSGSVAAPTAGLHFTEQINKELLSCGIEIIDLTLHVGAGTFKPVKSNKIGDHDMHQELIIVEKNTIKKLGDSKNIIAVGTTSVRTIESLYQLALMIYNKEIKSIENINIPQWYAYNKNTNKLSKSEAVKILLKFVEKHNLDKLIFHTSIMIAPGYSFGFVDGMVTNFHQPHSTLLLLISAFTNNRWREIYNHAIDNDYRFLSYGDSSLIIP